MPDKTSPDLLTDRDRFEDLYRERRDRLVSSMTGILRDRDRAEDLAETAFHTAWEKRDQFRGESSLSTWVHAIAFNAARKDWRKERLMHRDPIVAETLRDTEPDRVSARLEEEEMRAQVWKALDQIPAKPRRLLIDHYIDGRSVQEIARHERVPEGTIGSRLFAARQMLRDALQAPAPARKPMPEDKVRQIADDALKHLAEELQVGRSEALKTYLAAMGRFHHYSWNNVLLVQAQRPTATRVAGYHTWRDLGRFVRAGEKGIVIYAPIVAKASGRDERTARRDAPQPRDDERSVVGFRTAYVFDIAQTDGRPLPAFAQTTGDPQSYGERLKALIASHGIALEYDPSIAPSLGESSSGRIRVLPGQSPAEEFSTIVHELAHELMHHPRGATQVPKIVRETQAEAVAYVVSRGIGLESNRSASDYIALYNGDVKVLAESLASIQRTASHISEDLLPRDHSMPSPERRSGLDEGSKRGHAGDDRAAGDPPRRDTGPALSDTQSLDR